MATHELPLNESQIKLLHDVVAAARALPDAHRFTCTRIDRWPFAWVIHDGFRQQVTVASWDDIEALEDAGYVTLTSDDPDDCTFVLSEHVRNLDLDRLLAPEKSPCNVDDGGSGNNV